MRAGDAGARVGGVVFPGCCAARNGALPIRGPLYNGAGRSNGQASLGRGSRQGNAMSASTIRLVAANRQSAFRLRGVRTLPLLPAIALLFSATVSPAAEEPSKPFLEKNSFYLKSAGFRIQFANDPAGQKALRALPAHRFVANGVGDAVRYLYAEPRHCVCIFVGTQQAYDRYRDFLSQPLKPADHVSADYKTQSGILLSNQPLRQSTRGDPTNLSDYLSTIR